MTYTAEIAVFIRLFRQSNTCWAKRKENSMKKEIRTRVLTALISIVGLLLSGCVSRQPIYLDPTAFDQNIDTIYVTPVIDARTDKSEVFDASDIANLRKLAMNGLDHQGYHAQLLDSWKTDKQLSDRELGDMSAEELCNITPAEAKVFFVITINDVHDTYKVMSSNYSINGMMMAIDRERKKEIWKDVETGTHGGGGLIEAALQMIGRKSIAQDALMRQVLSSFPNKD